MAHSPRPTSLGDDAGGAYPCATGQRRPPISCDLVRPRATSCDLPQVPVADLRRRYVLLLCGDDLRRRRHPRPQLEDAAALLHSTGTLPSYPRRPTRFVQQCVLITPMAQGPTGAALVVCTLRSPGGQLPLLVPAALQADPVPSTPHAHLHSTTEQGSQPTMPPPCHHRASRGRLLRRRP